MSSLAESGPELEQFLQVVMPKIASFFFILNACSKKLQGVKS
jgi:hypothetical protein